MQKPFTQIYVHLVWATWDRLPLLQEEIQERVYACIQAECHQMGAEVVAIGGVEDHIHLLVQLPTTLSIAHLAKQMKGASSHFVTHVLRISEGFKWQGAYGAFTVSKADVPRIKEYIHNQAKHHQMGSLEDEWEQTR